MVVFSGIPSVIYRFASASIRTNFKHCRFSYIKVVSELNFFIVGNGKDILWNPAKFFKFYFNFKSLFFKREKNSVKNEKKLHYLCFFSDTGKFLCIHTRQDVRRNNLKVYILAMGNYTPRIVIENVLSQLTICKTPPRRILETMTTWWI